MNGFTGTARLCKRCGITLVSPFGNDLCGGIACSFLPPPPPVPQPFKDDSAKLPMHLLPVDPVQDVVKVLAFGAKKYAADAWRAGIAWTRILDAAERHLASFKKGDDLDSESGLNHLAHAACNLLFVLEYTRTSQRLDDRYSTVQRKAIGNRQLHDVIDGSGPCLCGATHTSR